MPDRRFEKAIELLEHPETYPSLPERNAREISLRLCHFPALAPYWTWTIFKNKDTIYLRRVVWSRKNTLPEPTMYAAEVEIPSDVYNKIMKKLTSIKIPPFVPVSILALDGETFHIECGDYHCSSKLQWWCDAPPGWKKLESWFHKTVSHFESLLPACTIEVEHNS